MVTVTRPSNPSTGIEGFLGLSATCIKCGAERELEGRKIMEADTDDGATYGVETPEPCECGAKVIRVSYSLGIF